MMRNSNDTYKKIIIFQSIGRVQRTDIVTTKLLDIGMKIVKHKQIKNQKLIDNDEQ